MRNWIENNLKIISGGFALFMFFFIYYVSSLQFPLPPSGVSIISGKAIIYHMSVFFLLMMFLFLSFFDGKWKIKEIILSILIVLIYARLDELHQFFVPGRFMSTNDFLIDSIGIAFASLVYFILIELKK